LSLSSSSNPSSSKPLSYQICFKIYISIGERRRILGDIEKRGGYYTRYKNITFLLISLKNFRFSDSGYDRLRLKIETTCLGIETANLKIETN